MLDDNIHAWNRYRKKTHGLDRLHDAVKDRSLILFGESCHGVADFNLIISDIIIRLHDLGGCDVVAFEAGIGECFHASLHAASMEPEEMVKSSMYLSSKCEEIVPLFRYIRSVRHTDNPLYSIGIDPRPLNSSRTWLLSVIRHHHYENADPLEETEGMVCRWGARGFIQDDASAAEYDAHRDICDAGYRELLKFITERRAKSPAVGDDAVTLAVAARVAENRLGILGVLNQEGAYYEYREKAMADNIRWIREELFPGRRIAVWGHSGHTRKMGSKTDATPSMGECLASLYGDTLYSVGIFPYGGRGAWNNREEYVMAIPPEKSLEARLHLEEGAVFADLGELARQGERWPGEPCTTLSWGIDPELLVPIEQFDGVLVVSNVSPPTYLR